MFLFLILKSENLRHFTLIFKVYNFINMKTSGGINIALKKEMWRKCFPQSYDIFVSTFVALVQLLTEWDFIVIDFIFFFSVELKKMTIIYFSQSIFLCVSVGFFFVEGFGKRRKRFFKCNFLLISFCYCCFFSVEFIIYEYYIE